MDNDCDEDSLVVVGMTLLRDWSCMAAGGRSQKLRGIENFLRFREWALKKN